MSRKAERFTASLYRQPRYWGGVAMLLMMLSLWIASSCRGFRGGYQTASHHPAYEVSFERGCLQVGQIYHFPQGTVPPSSRWYVRQVRNLAVDFFPGIYDSTYVAGSPEGFTSGSCVRIPLWIAPLGWLAFWAGWVVWRNRKEGAYLRDRAPELAEDASPRPR